ncbi:PP2C family protein-serine/threonine phosphatase [Streptomyces sp. Ru73]|uniref:PP2C family protein-serine/threonine phosphatase n=1 Tax=Streptomyces sp. Ru73 TaxID=2080748 RepID=UPI00215613B4|nr:PP2C family protein-serine/threonine phosphatase [Streptomyces sp. Ru73]
MEFIGAWLGYGCGFAAGLGCGLLAVRGLRAARRAAPAPPAPAPTPAPDAHHCQEAALVAVAQATQQALLRPFSGEVGGVGMAARYLPAAENVLVGGDLINVAHTPYGLRVLVGDVRGHDLEAARLAAVTIGCFRDHAFTTPDLVRLTGILDERLCAELDEEGFVTAVLAEFAPGEVRLVNCGHPAPLRLGDRLEPLAPADPGPPLGLHPAPRMQRARLAANERLLLYTDGLIEALDAHGVPFPLDERVREALARPALDDALEELHTLLKAHTAAPLRDDLALLLCQPGVRPPVPQVPALRDAGERTGGLA